MDRRRYLQAVGIGGVFALPGCTNSASPTEEQDASGESLTLATATTTYDSGLLDEVLPRFEQQFGTQVETVVRGTGGALRTARDGDCDVVLVHARPLEDEFLRDGYGINRRRVMINDFLVVGPEDDPAGIAGTEPVAAFKAIAEAEATFISRGDRSGTHFRERQIWTKTGIDPDGSWYSETGQGMGNTLVFADQSDAYTLTERGTFLNVATNTLVALVEHEITDPPPLLRNEYTVIPTNPAYHDVVYPLSMAFIGYLTESGQAAIDEFRVSDQPAFLPIALSEDPAFEQYVPSDWR